MIISNCALIPRAFLAWFPTILLPDRRRAVLLSSPVGDTFRQPFVDTCSKSERMRCCRTDLGLTSSDAQLSELPPPKGDVYGIEMRASASYHT